MKVNEEYLKWCFGYCDKDSSGYLDEQELSYVAHLAGSVHTKGEFQSVLEKLDKNDDGKVSYEEFCEFMRQQKDPRQSLFEAFHCVANDDSGFIGRWELRDILCMDDENSEDEVDEVLNKFDVDGDNRLNVAEFIEMMTKTLEED